MELELTVAQERREQLNAIFKLFVNNVYFQAPPNTVMQYPCIRYEQDDAETLFANNLPYRHTRRYQVIAIDFDADSVLQEMIADLPMCQFNRHYTADDLHHFVFTLFF